MEGVETKPLPAVFTALGWVPNVVEEFLAAAFCHPEKASVPAVGVVASFPGRPESIAGDDAVPIEECSGPDDACGGTDPLEPGCAPKRKDAGAAVDDAPPELAPAADVNVGKPPLLPKGVAPVLVSAPEACGVAS